MRKAACFILLVAVLFKLSSGFFEFYGNDAFISDSANCLKVFGGNGDDEDFNNGETEDTSSDSSIPIEPIIYILTASSTIAFLYRITKRSRLSKKLMKKLKASDDSFKYKDIKSSVKESFFAIQSARTNMDMTPAKYYLSDELFENMQSKLDWMSFRNELLVLKNISFLSVLPVAVHDEPGEDKDFIWFYIMGSMSDYIINTATQLKTSGDTIPAFFMEFWQFKRKDGHWVLNKILQKDEEDKIPYN